MFDDDVRQPGRRYLAKTPRPTTKQFASHAYWTAAKRDLYDAYGGICNFVCHWIPPDTGSITVEHFRPKSRFPRLAYEWTNLRLMCGTLNGRKKDFQDVLDPVSIDNGMFVLDFPSLLIKASQQLPQAQARRVVFTINRLRLNDEGTCVKARERYIKRYCKGLIDFELLAADAPFIAYELRRQGLVDEIRNIMVYA